MSELREMHLSELLTILAEVPGDRLDHFNNAIRMAKNCEAERSALLRERDEAVKHLRHLTEHWSAEDGTIAPFAEDVDNAVNFLATQGSSTNTNSEP